jgi:hypothetical protein
VHAAIVGAQINFGVSNFSLLHIGKQRFLSFDAQEAQFVVMLVCIITGVWPAFWTTPLVDLGASVSLPECLGGLEVLPAAPAARDIALLQTAAQLTLNCSRNIATNVLHYWRGEKCRYSNPSGQTPWTLAHQSVCYVGFGAAAMLAGANLSNRMAFWPWLFATTFASAHMTNHLLIARATGLPFPLFPAPLGIVAAMAGAHVLGALDGSCASDQFAVLATAAWASYSLPMLHRVASALDISVLTISK